MTTVPPGSRAPAGPPGPPADVHLSTGAMALDALPADEATAFGEHLADCPTCSEEYRGLQATVAMLGAAEAERPPRGLRARVLNAAARTPQLPPLIAGKPGRHRTDAATADAAAADRGVTPIGSAPSRRASWLRRPTGWLAAAAAAVVIGAGITLAVNNGDNSPPTASDLSQCVAADRAVAQLKPNVGDGGSLTRSDSCGAAVLHLPQMAAPKPGQAYQMWVITGSTPPKSLGMVPSLAGADLPLQIHPGDAAIAVTVEPAAGSVEPTQPPVWKVNLH